MSIHGISSNYMTPTFGQRRAAEPAAVPRGQLDEADQVALRSEAGLPCAKDFAQLRGAAPLPVIEAGAALPPSGKLAEAGMRICVMAGLGGWLGAIAAKCFVNPFRRPREEGVVSEKSAEPDALKAATSTPYALALREAAANIAGVPPAQARVACKMLEDALSDPNASVLDVKTLGTGINQSFIVTLSNGVKGIFKPGAGETQEKLREQLEENHQSKREEAAYLVDKAMGHLGRIPPVVSREIDGQQGILMAFIPDSKPADSKNRAAKKLLKDPEHPDYHRIAVLDNVIGNLDRHTGNWMLTRGGNAVPIDHGLSFPLQNRDQGYTNFDFEVRVMLNSADHEALSQLRDNREELQEKLAPLLDREAVKGMFWRVDRLLQDGFTWNGWRRSW